MIRYCYRRILLAVPVMIGISLLAFILGLLSPGDPAEFALNQDGLDAPTDAQIAAMREELGLNRPIYVQYFGWFVQVLHGNFGSSYITGKDILHELLLRLPVTVDWRCWHWPLLRVLALHWALYALFTKTVGWMMRYSF